MMPSAEGRSSFSSSCLSSLSRSTTSCGDGDGGSATAARPQSPWLAAQDRLSSLLASLRQALGRMEQDRRQVLLGCPEAASLTERLQQSLQAYLEPAECAALRAFQADDLGARLRATAAVAPDCSPELRASLCRLEARVRAALEDAALLREDVALLADLPDAGPSEERCVSRAFLSDLASRAHQAERENRSLRASQAKLKRVLRDAKEQRRQLKELARRLKQEREQAVLEVCRLSDQLRRYCDVRTSSEEVDHHQHNDDETASAAVDADACTEDQEDVVDDESRTTRSATWLSSCGGADGGSGGRCSLLGVGVGCVSGGVRRSRLPSSLGDRRGKLCIFVRVRPDRCCSGTRSLLDVVSGCKLVLRTHGVPGASASLSAFNCRAFYYDRVFGADSTSDCVFGAMSELVNACCYGVNVCIMAYGQTGSGKTYTMVGDQLNPGVNRLSIASVLRFCRDRAGWQYSFALSAVEIYKEEIRDLLRPAAHTTGRPGHGSLRPAARQPALKLVTGFNGEAVILGLTELPVTTEADIDNCIAQCESTRIYSATNLNEVSSRSHVIVMLKISGRNSAALEQQPLKSTLTLCDLAGSESVVKSGVRGAGLREASAINRSLLSLGKVFEDLRKRQRPCFRESKLTRLLQPHLTGSSKCLVIVTVRQAANHLDETVRSLMFGQSAMQTEPRNCPAGRDDGRSRRGASDLAAADSDSLNAV